MDFYWPGSPGEWLAWASAVVTVLLGLSMLAAPRAALRLLSLHHDPGRPAGLAEIRGRMAGFYLGLGLSAILFAQPFLWMALGAGWALTAFGRLVSMVADRGFTAYNACAITVELVLALLPLAYVLGYG